MQHFRAYHLKIQLLGFRGFVFVDRQSPAKRNRPSAQDEAAYPRAFENTLLAFLIFGGIYLMFSLTASILREQVSS